MLLIIGSLVTAGDLLVAAEDGKPRIPPKPADFDQSPAGVAVRVLDTRLRNSAPDYYGGLAIGRDGAVEVFTTSANPTVTDIITEVTVATRGQIAIRATTGVTNSLIGLERLRDQITRDRTIREGGIELTQVGPDVMANKVAIGVNGLTPEIVAVLKSRFGAAKVTVFENAGWRTTSRTSDTSPWYGGLWINHSNPSGTPTWCTSGYTAVRNFDVLQTTAGHCGVGSPWINGSAYIGNTTDVQLTPWGSGDAQLMSAIGGTLPYIYVEEYRSIAVATWADTQAISQSICSDGAVGGALRLD
jgi:hypothetical protein